MSAGDDITATVVESRTLLYSLVSAASIVIVILLSSGFIMSSIFLKPSDSSVIFLSGWSFRFRRISDPVCELNKIYSIQFEVFTFQCHGFNEWLLLSAIFSFLLFQADRFSGIQALSLIH